jgi:phosphopantothenoylcysteine decarboxylase/phosphopantothenate--cysteine ligase
VTGCVGAYKAAELLRLLQKAGVDVEVALTESATHFVGEATFAALTGQPVARSLWTPAPDGRIRHIAFAQSIDLLVVAPATANALGKFANGICDDLVSTIYVSTTAPVLIAPAMNVEMWRHPATQENLERLRRRGVHVVEPDVGYLACGSEGEGRLANPEAIAERALALLGRRTDLVGEHVLVTAGPTREPIDPVRFLSNRSSGRMGYAIAAAARQRGAAVMLVSGPVSLPAPFGVELVRVETAAEMAEATLERAEAASVVVKAAAVADYRPVAIASRKIKKGADTQVIELEKTVDILSALAAEKGDRVLVGFAAETEDLVAHARQKLERKGVDLVVANDVSRGDAGFDADDNAATLVWHGGELELPLMSKAALADRILDWVVDRLHARRHSTSDVG